MTRYLPNGRLEAILIGGAQLPTDIAAQTISASLSDPVGALTELTLTINDPGLNVYTRGLFAIGAPVRWNDLDLQIATVQVGPGDTGAGQIEIGARPRRVRELQELKGPKVLSATSPSDAVRLLAAGPVMVEPGLPRGNISVTGETEQEKPESYWTAFERWAGESGAIVFEQAGVIWFGKPSWIKQNMPAGPAVHWAGPDESDPYLLSMPVCRRTEDDAEEPATIELSVHPSLGERYRSGMRVAFTGIPKFEGEYWVASVDADMRVESPWTIQLAVPVDPKPSGDNETPGKKAGSSATKPGWRPQTERGKTVQTVAGMVTGQ